VKTYFATFHGRAKGAIGRFYTCSDTVEAEDAEAARLKLYDKWEHIDGLRLTPATLEAPKEPPAPSGICTYCNVPRSQCDPLNCREH
jgi:hypothetical protein